METIPVKVNDRRADAAHALEHGQIRYSRPALEAYLDYIETHTAAEVINTSAPPGVAPEVLRAFQQQRRESLHAIHALSRARVLGAFDDNRILQILAQIYAVHSQLGILMDYLQMTIEADHPLETCPNPPAEM